MKNYHTHTKRCQHAIGNEEEYILEAIKGGYTELGFSDHTPWEYDSLFIPFMRMKETQLDDYVYTLRKLRDKYKDQISIKIGLEVEYFERYMPWLEKQLKDKEIDYIILGNHYDSSDEYGVYYGSPINYQSFIKYINQCMKAIDTGLFSYIAHPDLARFNENDYRYVKEYTRLCEHAKAKDIPLEFNLLGFKGHRHYPNPVFWKIVSKVGNKVIIGTDAHEPYRLSDKETYKKAIEYLKELNIEVIEDIKFLR